jgi:hypothetical protein
VIRHTVLLQFSDAAGAHAGRAAIGALAELMERDRRVRAWALHEDLGLPRAASRTPHAPAETTFDCAADLDAYVNSEAHVRLGRERLTGACTAVLGLQHRMS